MGKDTAKLSHHYITVDGSRIHYVTAGTGKPLVLLHGILSDWKEWEVIVPSLVQRYRLFMLDLPGFGESEILKKSHTLAEYASFLQHLLDALKLKKIYLGGMSLGGMVALTYACSSKNVQRLFLLSTPSYFCQSLKKELTILARLGNVIEKSETSLSFMNKIQKNTIAMNILLNILHYNKGNLLEGIRQAGPRAIIESLADIVHTDLRKSVSVLAIPVLCIVASDDRFAPADTVVELGGLCKKGTVVIIPAHAHLGPSDAPVRIVQEISGFFPISLWQKIVHFFKNIIA